MKKIVFLFLLSFIIPITVKGKEVTTTCHNGEIEVNENYEEGISVIKRGPDPFLSVIDEGDGRYYVRDVECTDNEIILFGYVHFKNHPTFYEGYMIVLDDRGNEIYRELYDYGELEEVYYVKHYDHIYAVVVQQYEYTQEPTFMNSYVIIYDSEFNQLEEYTYNEEISDVLTKDNLLAIEFNFKRTFHIGIVSNLEEIYPNQIFNFEESYNQPVNIPFINKAYLNGEEVFNGVTISYPGEYTFEYNDQVYHFTVHPTITGVEDKAMYYEPVSIDIDEGNALLNNELYSNGTLITEPGNYQLKVEGAGNYTYELTFTIGSTIQGLVNGFEYQKPITISFTGQGFLNSNQVTSPIVVDQEGEYVFRVLGENGYSEEYHFNLNYEKEFNLVEFIQKIDIFIMVGVVITGVVIIKKSK